MLPSQFYTVLQFGKKNFLIHFELTLPQIWFKLVTFFNIEVGKGNIICWKKVLVMYKNHVLN